MNRISAPQIRQSTRPRLASVRMLNRPSSPSEPVLSERIPSNGCGAYLLNRVTGAENCSRTAHDPLTLLPGRTAFQSLLDVYLEVGDPVALITVDIDDFKDINDTLGFDAGDEILRNIADALLSAAKPDEIVFRTGGDEFAVIAPVIGNINALKARMAEFQEALRYETCFGQDHLVIHASLGGVLSPLHARSRAEMMQFAAIALAEAKRLGGDRAEVFRQATLRSVRSRHSMRARASTCLQVPDRLHVHYQPQVDLQTRAIVGYEALVRCTDEQGQIKGPDWISAAFDDAALSLEIGRRVRRECFDFIKSLIQSGNQHLTIALNATPWELQSPEWAQTILSEAACAGVPFNALEVEVTESVVLTDNAKTTISALELLHSAGVAITLDDFGTGFASLSHLRCCPIDSLKIDRSFTRNVFNADAAAIVRAIIGLGKSLNMRIVAEGVETLDQHRLLKTWGCDYGQGFLYGHALPQALAMFANQHIMPLQRDECA